MEGVVCQAVIFKRLTSSQKSSDKSHRIWHDYVFLLIEYQLVSAIIFGIMNEKLFAQIHVKIWKSISYIILCKILFINLNTPSYQLFAIYLILKHRVTFHKKRNATWNFLSETHLRVDQNICAHYTLISDIISNLYYNFNIINYFCPQFGMKIIQRPCLYSKHKLIDYHTLWTRTSLDP